MLPPIKDSLATAISSLEEDTNIIIYVLRSQSFNNSKITKDFYTVSNSTFSQFVQEFRTMPTVRFLFRYAQSADVLLFYSKRLLNFDPTIYVINSTD